MYYIKFIGSGLHKVYLEVVQNGSFEVIINKGNIKFIIK